MKKLVCIICSAILAVSLFGCGKTEDTTKDAGISVIATIFPAYDFARAVVGDDGSVSMLIKPGTEIHTYDPTAADIAKIERCDVFIYNGGEADAWVDTVLDSIDTSRMTIIRMMDAVTPVEEETVEGMESEKTDSSSNETEYDEHIWTSPANAILIIKEIRDAMCTLDPINTEAYCENSDAYILQIQDVQQEIQTIVSQAKHKIIVVGDRFPFRYFVDEFGLDYRAAFNGCSEDTEASASTIAYLIDTIEENKLSAVFYIELSNQQIATAISEQTGAQMLELNSCHNISQEDFDSGMTYVDIMKQNAENLRIGLN
ncbi:MAG: metal ABC transporter substrate-binding protein [Anaerofustis sp.]